MNLFNDGLCQLPAAYHVGLIFLVSFSQMFLDHWMGKTDKVKSNSLMEFLVLGPINFIFRKGKTNDEPR